jgi:hypothetical protein
VASLDHEENAEIGKSKSVGTPRGISSFTAVEIHAESRCRYGLLWTGILIAPDSLDAHVVSGKTPRRPNYDRKLARVPNSCRSEVTQTMR